MGKKKGKKGGKKDEEKAAKLRARKDAAAAKKAAKRAKKDDEKDAAEDAMLAAAMGDGGGGGGGGGDTAEILNAVGAAGGADLLATIKAIQSRKAATLAGTVVTELSTEAPKPRCYTNAVVMDSGDIAIFGGEWWDGRHTTMYGDMLVFSPKSGGWRIMDAPTSPPPRSSHQVVAVRESLYVFGGEFSTTDTFYHYKDMWRFDCGTMEWENIALNGDAPSQRSGHRMAVWSHYLVLFGGFYDVSREMKYYNDTYLFCLRERRWRRLQSLDAAHRAKPSPRSSACVAVYGDTFFVYGGFAEVRVSTKTSYSQQLSDMWALELSKGDKGVLESVEAKWVRVPLKGMRPANRTSMAYSVYKNRKMVFFGGVTDVTNGTGGPQHKNARKGGDGGGGGGGYNSHDKKGGKGGGNRSRKADRADEEIGEEAEFANDLFVFDMERRQFYSMPLRKKKAAGQKKLDAAAKRAKRKAKRQAKIKGKAGRGASGGDGEQEAEEGDEREDVGHDDEEKDDKGDEDDEDDDTESSGVVFTIEDLDDDKLYYIQNSMIIEVGKAMGDGQQQPPAAPSAPQSGAMAPGQEHEDEDTLCGGGESKQQSRKQRARQEEAKAKAEAEAKAKAEAEAGRGMPRARFKATSCVCGNTMYVYGGMWEEKGGAIRERVALDDLWSIDLSKLVQWELLHEDSGRGADWKGGDDDEDRKNKGAKSGGNKTGGAGAAASGTGTGDAEADASVGNGGESKASLSTVAEVTAAAEDAGSDEYEWVSDEDEGASGITDYELLHDFDPVALVAMSEDERKILIAVKKIEFGLVQVGGEKSMLFLEKLGFLGQQNGRAGVMPVPVFGGEKLKQFFNRTADYWMFAEATRVGSSLEPRKGKDLRKAAFGHAESRFRLLSPLIQKLDDIEEARKGMRDETPGAGGCGSEKEEGGRGRGGDADLGHNSNTGRVERWRRKQVF